MPGKDPPSPSNSPPARGEQTSPNPQLVLPPNPETAKPLRPSPLRNSTSDSLHPKSAENAEAPNQGQQAEVDVQRERPPLAPLFTLIHNPSTNTTHHPSRIHYIFSDDDNSLLTAACLRSLAPPASLEASVRNSSTSSSSSATFRKAQPQSSLKGKEKERVSREERVVVVELGEDGDTVLSAASMSESWQVVGASVENAPTWEGTSGEEAGLMLRIEGVGSKGGMEEGIGLGIADVERRKSGEVDEEEMQKLMEDFDRKMVMLRRVVEAGGKAETGGK